MRTRRGLLTLSFLIAVARPARAEPAAPAEPAAEASRWYVGTSAWLVMNAVLDDSPDFYYVEIDRAFDDRHALVIEPVTWRYRAPIGIPMTSSSYGDVEQEYPGFVRSVGVGVGWRYTIYRGLNASARAMHMLQFYAEDHKPRTTGYQLFLQARVGWRWSIGKPGIWIEPSVGFNWWPIEVGRPESFRRMDDRWPSYYLFEPWLNAGWHW